MPFDMKINMSLQNIQFNIMSLPVIDSFKTLLLGDINLAIYYYDNLEIQNVQNYLSLLMQRISNHIPSNTFLCDQYDLLLTDCYSLLQALTASPESMELGPDESKHMEQISIEQELIEPESTEQASIEPEPVKQASTEQEPIKPELKEQDLIEQELIKPEPVIQASFEQEPVVREETMIPVNTPGPEKLCLRWNFPVSPSR